MTTDVTVRALADRLGLTATQVKSRRETLRAGSRPLKEPALPAGMGKGRQHWLVAKTCARCGALRMRDEFPKRGSFRLPECRRCDAERTRAHYARDLERSREKSRTQVAQTQTWTLARADRRGDPWSPDDYEIVVRDDLTEREKATELGRTLYAVAHAIARVRRGEVQI